VREELGLLGKVQNYIGNYAFNDKNQVILCYEVEAVGEIKLNHELAEIKQLSADELLEYDFSPLEITKEIIQDWREMR